MTRRGRKVINLDDPNLKLEINTDDFTSEFLKEIKKKEKKRRRM